MKFNCKDGVTREHERKRVINTMEGCQHGPKKNDLVGEEEGEEEEEEILASWL
jgi:hypothetical protein